MFSSRLGKETYASKADISEAGKKARRRQATIAGTIATLAVAGAALASETGTTRVQYERPQMEEASPTPSNAAEGHVTYQHRVGAGDVGYEVIAEKIAASSHGAQKIDAEVLQPYLHEAHTPNSPGIVQGDGVLQKGEIVRGVVPTDELNR